jgi:GAF domain-containing protein
MTTLQVEIAELMLATHAGRAILQLIEPARGAHVAAEAVSQGMQQMRHQTCGLKVLDALAASLAGRQREDFIEDDLALADESPFRVLFEQWGARTQIVAPLNRDGVLIGAIHLHRAHPPGHWSDSDRDALDQARRTISAQLDASAQRALPITASDLCDAAIQTLLDGLRDGLDVQRCTLRRNVSQAYAFPVIYESRAAQINSLLGDFTIIQSSQPVIHKLLAERSQVVEDDCASASDDPFFIRCSRTTVD